jgi:DNA recombination protein RmuC
MTDPIFLVIALVALAVAVAAGFWLARTAGASGRDLSGLEGQLRQLTDTHARTQAELARSLNERLDGVAKNVGHTLTQAGESTGKTLGELHERLVAIDAAQKGLSELSGHVVGLQEILGNKQARGAFGEVQLEAIVRDALPDSVCSFQATLSNGKRPDCLIRLPDPPGSIAIDAKFPLESYRELTAARDDAARTQSARAFTAAMQKHIDDIAEKYILPGETAPMALMFLPSEAVYAELNASFPNIVETARRRNVLIVSPTTLMLVLLSVGAILKDARMHEQAAVIQKEVGQLAADIIRLDDRVEKLRNHFDAAGRDIDQIVISAKKITKQAERIETMQIEEAVPIEEGTRKLLPR